MPLKSRALAVLFGGATLFAASAANAAEPITIGFDIEETGGLAVNAKQSLLALKIWAEQTNAKGGLLGRPVKLVSYDDQCNPALVPGIITKLLDMDKVDILIGGNGTNMLVPAMPVVIQHNLTFLGLFGLDVNSEFHYDELLLHHPGRRPEPARGVLAGLLQGYGDDGPEAADHRPGRGRRRVLQERRGWRPRPGEARRTEDRV